MPARGRRFKVDEAREKIMQDSDSDSDNPTILDPDSSSEEQDKENVGPMGDNRGQKRKKGGRRSSQLEQDPGPSGDVTVPR